MKEIENKGTLIRSVFSDLQLKALYYICLRTDIEDNNDKAGMIKAIIPEEFTEIGTGTNRIAFAFNGFVYKIALDRRGLADNLAEFKRSSEIPSYLAKTYESNYLINVAEYVNIIDRDDFIQNESTIKYILNDLAEDYLFDDIGYSLKNYCNWGYRMLGLDENGKDKCALVILDYGYLYPLFGQDRDRLYRCPRCGSRLTWNTNFTEFMCTNSNGNTQSRCSGRYSPMTLRRNMRLDLETAEDNMIMSFNNLQKPNLDTIEKSLSKLGGVL